MIRYSNARALKALVKASLQSILKSPSAIVFGIAFPLIFILVFGFLGNGGGGKISVSMAPGSDTSSPLYASLQQMPVLKWKSYATDEERNKALSEGDIVALLHLEHQEKAVPRYRIAISASPAEPAKMQQLQGIVQQIVQLQDPEIGRRTEDQAEISVKTAVIREFKTIDFILPGQLGFSLLAGSVFGTAFVFFNMRSTLVLKRFFATPVRREVIVISEGLARMIFQLLTAIIIIGIGYMAFDFTLIHGVLTFLSLLALCALGIMVFMGFGFIVSGVAKSESTIPPFANLITLPQFLLAGTFFPVDAFPKWLQPISRAMPLTYLNDALRKTAFEGAGLWTLRWDILVLLGWGVLVYAVATRLFKWE